MHSHRLPRRDIAIRESRHTMGQYAWTRNPPGRGQRSLPIVLTDCVLECVPQRSPAPLPKPLFVARCHYILAKEHRICDFIKPNPSHVSRKIFAAPWWAVSSKHLAAERGIRDGNCRLRRQFVHDCTRGFARGATRGSVRSSTRGVSHGGRRLGHGDGGRRFACRMSFSR